MLNVLNVDVSVFDIAIGISFSINTLLCRKLEILFIRLVFQNHYGITLPLVGRK
jgi:hypothetical protein